MLRTSSVFSDNNTEYVGSYVEEFKLKPSEIDIQGVHTHSRLFEIKDGFLRCKISFTDLNEHLKKEYESEMRRYKGSNEKDLNKEYDLLYIFTIIASENLSKLPTNIIYCNALRASKGFPVTYSSYIKSLSELIWELDNMNTLYKELILTCTKGERV